MKALRLSYKIECSKKTNTMYKTYSLHTIARLCNFRSTFLEPCRIPLSTGDMPFENYFLFLSITTMGESSRYPGSQLWASRRDTQAHSIHGSQLIHCSNNPAMGRSFVSANSYQNGSLSALFADATSQIGQSNRRFP